MGEKGGVPAGVKEIEFLSDHADAKMVLEVHHVAGTKADEVSAFAAELQKRAVEIKGVAIFAQPQPGSGLQPELKETMGSASLQYRVGDRAFRVSAGSFFQTNRFLVRDLAQIVGADFFGKIALDLYA